MAAARLAMTLDAVTSAGPRDWSVPAVAAALGQQVQRTDTGRYVTADLGDGVHIEVVADPDVADPSASAAVYGIYFTPAGGRFDTALAEVGTVLGPPPTVGGPGPFARWPQERTWWTLARSPSTGRVRLFAEPAERAGRDEYRDFEYGALSSLPYLWRLDDPQLLPAGTWVPGVRPARTLEILERQLGAVCASLADAQAHLPGELADELADVTITIGTRKGGRLVRCRVDAQGCAVLVDRDWDNHPPSEAGARAVAGTAMAAVRGWGVDKPGKHLHEVSSTRSGRRLALPGLGLERGRS